MHHEIETSILGGDAHDGTAPTQARKSLEHVNGLVFQSGDRILFQARMCCKGRLKPPGFGKLVGGQPVPIVIGMYGNGTNRQLWRTAVRIVPDGFGC